MNTLNIYDIPGQTVEQMREVYLDACEEYQRIYAQVAEIVDDLHAMYGDGVYQDDYYHVLMKEYTEKSKSLTHMAQVKDAFKKRYRSMKKKAKCEARRAAAVNLPQNEPQVCEPDIIEITQEEVADYAETRFPIVVPMMSSSTSLFSYAQVHAIFRHFKMNVDGTCSFQIEKDGACYEDMLLPCHKAVTVATLRVYAGALQLKGRGSMRKADLLQVLCPIMDEVTTYSAW